MGPTVTIQGVRLGPTDVPETLFEFFYSSCYFQNQIPLLLIIILSVFAIKQIIITEINTPPADREHQSDAEWSWQVARPCLCADPLATAAPPSLASDLDSIVEPLTTRMRLL